MGHYDYIGLFLFKKHIKPLCHTAVREINRRTERKPPIGVSQSIHRAENARHLAGEAFVCRLHCALYRDGMRDGVRGGDFGGALCRAEYFTR